LNLSPNITAIMTGHGNIGSYLHRLKIIGCPECPCKHGTQTVDQLIFQCERLVNERAHLTSSVLTLILLTWRIWWAPNNASRRQLGFNSAFKGLKVGKWPVSKSELTNRYLKQLLSYINSIDLEKINQM